MHPTDEVRGRDGPSAPVHSPVSNDVKKRAAEFFSVWGELAGKNDRALAIVCLADMDRLLKLLLEAFLVDPAEEGLFEPHSPLGPVSAKIRMAYHLGLVTGTERDNLHQLNKIRHRFAHDVVSSFDDQDIADRCANLAFPDDLEESVHLKMQEPVNRFIAATLLLYYSLQFRALLARGDKRGSPDELGPSDLSEVHNGLRNVALLRRQEDC